MESRKKYLFILIVITTLFTIPKVGRCLFTWTPEKGWQLDIYPIKDTAKEQYQYGMELFKKGKYKAAYYAFDNLITNFPHSKYVQDSYFMRAESIFKLGTLYRAYLLYKKTLEKYPDHPKVKEILKREYEIACKFRDGYKREVPLININLLPARDEAIEIFREIVKNDPYGEYGAKSQFQIGRTLEIENELDKAIEEYDKVIDMYPNTKWAKKAAYRKSICEQKKTKGYEYDTTGLAKAQKQLEYYKRRIADKDEKKQIKKELKGLKQKQAKKYLEIAQYYEENRKYKAAVIYYTKIINEFKDTQYAKIAKKRLEALIKK